MTRESVTGSQQLADAFTAFEEQLRSVFAAEARQAVEAAAARMAADDGAFRIADVDVDVVIRSLTVEAGGRAEHPRTRRGRPHAGVRGRPPGALRGAIVDAFPDDGSMHSIDHVRAHLNRLNLHASTDNLHQHLRRLVQAGELERAGRGMYRRRTTP